MHDHRSALARRGRVGVAIAVIAGGVLATASPASAATSSWTGDAGTGDLSAADNWDPVGTPTSASDLVLRFTGASTFSLVNDLPGLPGGPATVGTLDFTASGYRLEGDPLNVNAAVNATGGSGTTTIGADLGLAAGAVGVNVTGAGTLALAGVVSNGLGLGSGGALGPQATPGGLVKTGSGTLVLAGDNTYTGDTVVQAGTLEVEGLMADGAPGPVDGSDIEVESGAVFTYSGTAAVSQLDVGPGATFLARVSTGTEPLQVADSVVLGGRLDVVVTGAVPTGTRLAILASTNPFGTEFSNAPDGSTVMAGNGQEFTVSYEDDQPGGESVVLTAGTPPEGTVERLSGETRIGTAIAVSTASYPQDGSAAAVVLARSDAFPDALAGTPLAVDEGGPLLITPPTVLEAAVLAEIERVLPPGGTVHLLGGPAALSADVEEAVVDAGFAVERIAGETRFETAVAIARALGAPSTLLLATGLDFADAVSAGAAAGAQRGAVLLTDGGQMPMATADYLESRSGVTVFAVGGPAAAAAGEAVTAIVGADRYETAVEVAREFFATPTQVGVASGLAFPDALTGGVQIASRPNGGGPLLLTRPDALPDVVAGYVGSTGTISTVVVYGGTAAVGEAVAADLEALL